MIRTKYAEIEQEIIPVMEFLEKNKNNEKYKHLYKGFITLQSPLILNPDILFIGINPGDGAFIENKNKGISETIRVFSPELDIELDWFKDGNAYGYYDGKKWYGFKWYQRDKKINNSFTARMIDLLYEIGKLKYPEKYKTQKFDNNSLPFWYESLGKNIMYTNLYPIATSNTVDLKKIFKELSKEQEIKCLFNKQEGLKEWDIQLFFIRKIKNLVNLVQPKVIVCIGTKVYNDFTYTHKKKSDKIFTLHEECRTVIGYSRLGNWSGLIPELAKLITEEIK